MAEAKVTAVEDQAAQDRSKVFISYSRDDLEFADRIHDALSERGVDVAIDREEIAHSEEWWARIKQLITEADAVVFVLSPSSVRSEVCGQEVAVATGLNKRLIPIVARDVAGQEVPDALAALNYIFFFPNGAVGATGDFGEALDQLAEAIALDIGWVREHTRLGALAVRWLEQNKPGALALRDEELSQAETWLTSHPPRAPNPTDAHRALIAESRQLATSRQRRIVGVSLGVAMVASVLAGIALWQWRVAVDERDIANGRHLVAQSGWLRAEQPRSLRASLGDALVALKTLEAHDQPSSEAYDALLHALEVFPQIEHTFDMGADPSRVIVDEDATATALFDEGARHRIRAYGPDGKSAWDRAIPWGHGLSPDGRFAATISETSGLEVHDLRTGARVGQLPVQKFRLIAITALKDGAVAVAVSGDSADSDIQLWHAAPGKPLVKLRQVGLQDYALEKLAFSPDGSRLIVSSRRALMGRTVLYDTPSGAVVRQLEHENEILQVTVSPDNRFVATATRTYGKAQNPWKLAVRDVATNQVLHHALVGHLLEANWVAVAFSPNSRLLAILPGEGPVQVLELATMLSFSISDARAGPYKASFSPDSASLLTVDRDGTAKIWDLETRRESARFFDRTRIHEAFFVKDGQGVVTVTGEGTVTHWALPEPQHTATFSQGGAGNSLGRAYVSLEANHMVINGLYDVVRWDLKSGAAGAEIGAGAVGVTAALGADGAYAVIGNKDGRVQVVDAVSGGLMGTAHVPEWPSALSVNAAGTKAFVILQQHDQREIWLARWDSGQDEVEWLAGHPQPMPDLSTLVLSREEPASAPPEDPPRIGPAPAQHAVIGKKGVLAVIATADDVLRTYSSEGGDPLAERPLEEAEQLVDMDDAEERIVTVLGTRRARIYRALDLTVVGEIDLGADERVVGLGPRGLHMLTLEAPDRLHVVRVADRKTILRSRHDLVSMSGCAHDVSFSSPRCVAAAFSPDGRLFASGGSDRLVRVWDLATAKELARISHRFEITAIRFGADGQLLTRMGKEDRLRQMRWRAAELKEVACEKLQAIARVRGFSAARACG